jgi:hypothetical protein
MYSLITGPISGHIDSGQFFQRKFFSPFLSGSNDFSEKNDGLTKLEQTYK